MQLPDVITRQVLNAMFACVLKESRIMESLNYHLNELQQLMTQMSTIIIIILLYPTHALHSCMCIEYYSYVAYKSHACIQKVHRLNNIIIGITRSIENQS